jgi:MFS family permease
VMACLGVAIVTTPLHLGRDYGLGPGPIGAITLSLAVAMALFAPVSARLSDRYTARRVLQVAMASLGVSLLLLGAVSRADYDTLVIVATVVSLVCVGAAIGAVQANAAFALMRSPAAAHGAALGVHNMIRFSGLAAGYAWVAISVEGQSLLVVYAGPVVLVAVSLVLLLGPPASPVSDQAAEPAR